MRRSKATDVGSLAVRADARVESITTHLALVAIQGLHGVDNTPITNDSGRRRSATLRPAGLCLRACQDLLNALG